VTIPAGEFVMGEDNEQHELDLPEYQIGKYPMTNAEFGRFIEARGYQEKRWWTDAGWKEKEESNWAEPRYWDNIPFNKPNRPVVGVSWYEAVAYCRWLSAESGRAYRLPTEAEWEKAARGPDGRVYPWGSEYEASRVNVGEGEQQVRATTPVGIYPSGVSPTGVYDSAGNVWEWCATKRGKAYPYNAAEDEWSEAYLEGTDGRVLRGGSWRSGRYVARCAYRSLSSPSGWYDDLGLRVMVSPSI
jgi:formylglycine-generating enzyme required for sulfatase activity